MSHPVDPPKTETTASGEARRRLLRGGIAAAPVVLTLTSRPVLGDTLTCNSPSRALSGTNSYAGPELKLCNGDSVSAWKSRSPHWPSGCPKHNDPFHGVNGFSGTSQLKSNGHSKTMLEVLSEAGVAAHFVAALLNIRTAKVSAGVLTEIGLKNLWTELSTTGRYSPFAGAKVWYPADVVTYFKQSGVAPA
jgi:hypothetical protein